MSYSNQVKIHEIEPVYYAQSQRAEFRLPPDKIFTTNLAIENMGLIKNANQARYSKWAGVYGTVKNLLILDGNVELVNLQRVHMWSGFKQFLHSNQYNESVGPYYTGGLMSNIWNQRDVTGNQAAGLIFGAKLQEGTIRALATNTTEPTTYKGRMMLSEILDLLSNMTHIDTSVFRNFRVIVEYQSPAEAITRAVRNNQNNGVTVNSTRPFLTAEEILDEETVNSIMGKLQPIEYKVIEQDVASLPAVAAAAGAGVTDTARTPTQQQTYHISGFNNKTLERILIWKQPTAAVNIQDAANGGQDAGHGIYNSVGFFKEKYQLRINGRNVFARSGLDKDNQRLAMMCDTWGANASLTPFNAGLAYKSPNATLRSSLIQTGNQDIGILDFDSADLGMTKEQDLQLDFERTGFFNDNAGGVGGSVGQTAQSKYNQTYSLVMFAEVRKAIVPSSSGLGYNVVYV